MKYECNYSQTDRVTELILRVDDRELAMALNPRKLLDDVRFCVVQQIGQAVMKRLGPAIDKALTEFTLNDPNVS